jgi:hypothetical protein
MQANLSYHNTKQKGRTRELENELEVFFTPIKKGDH